ncbi:MAG: aminotransferase class I/II-fold pyridoxal phosphate-dependent enzyme [Proteobacteria bacterium]|nr:aminotransferase class I/II-fold pyridoxal phosphate-dependent enzyme [Pseudomonadota bacterium]
MDRIDLRSDTVTLPTQAMREAMAKAEVGDDGREGDPTVRRLEEKAAAITGKEAGLFVVSGTMGNSVAMFAHTNRAAGTVLLDEKSHILRSEMGAIATLAGLFFKIVPAKRGAMDLDRLAEAIQSSLSEGELPTLMIEMETTHNGAGGTVLAPEHMQAVFALAKKHGIPVHTDGARFFNAAVKLGVRPSELARHTDSISFCLSKGLSAPVGSVIVGSKAYIQRARAWRRMLGGTLRQAGIIAAAGIIALETMIDRLAEDHESARRLAEGIHDVDPSLVDPRSVETNIVMLDFQKSGRGAREWAEALNANGLWVRPGGATRMRLVTHRHIGKAEVERAIAAFAKVSKELRARTPVRAVAGE